MKKMLVILMILGFVCSSFGLALSAPAQQAAPAATTAPAPGAKPAPKAAPQKMEAGYRGNPESKIYHNSSCRYYKGKSVAKLLPLRRMPRLPGTAPARSARARYTPGAGRERLFLCGGPGRGSRF